jgi:HEAT repeat protein
MNRWINHWIFCAVFVVAGLVALVGVRTSREHTVAQLIECLKDPDESVRAHARFRLMPDADSALPELLELLEGNNKHARREAVYFINVCRTHRDEDDGDLQRGVIEALAAFGPGAQAAVPKLKIILKEKRRYASEDISPISQRPCRFVPYALVRIQGKDALSTLLEQVNDPDVRVEVVNAIGMLGPAAADARSELEKMKTNADEMLLLAISEAIESIDGQ